MISQLTQYWTKVKHTLLRRIMRGTPFACSDIPFLPFYNPYYFSRATHFVGTVYEENSNIS